MSIPLFNGANLTDKSLNLANFNRIVDYVGRLAKMSSPNMTIDSAPTGYVLKIKPSTTSTMSYSDWAFGFSISGAVVTVNSGKIHHGTRAVVTCAGGDKTITADLQYLWVEYTFGSSATLAGPSTTRPVSTETVLRVWLAQFKLTTGVVSLNQIGRLGNIEITGAFG